MTPDPSEAILGETSAQMIARDALSDAEGFGVAGWTPAHTLAMLPILALILWTLWKAIQEHRAPPR